MFITAKNFPAIHKAFEMISHDRGSGAGHESYEVPDHTLTQVDLKDIEYMLANCLSTSDLETFCIGEFNEKEAIKKRLLGSDIHLADWFLESFFNDWEIDVT